MTIISQRDIRWSNEKISPTSLTLGGDGCLATVVASIAGITPSEAVQKLSFTDQGWLYWSSLRNVGLELVERGRTYNNDVVSKAISDHGFCVVQCDFDGNPRTNDQHWVRFDGNKRLMDPWVGEIRPTSWYSSYTGYAVIKRVETIGDELGKYTEKEMTAMRLERDKNWTKYKEAEQKTKELTKKLYELLADYK